jgi:hypothetical protein
LFACGRFPQQVARRQQRPQVGAFGEQGQLSQARQQGRRTGRCIGFRTDSWQLRFKSRQQQLAFRHRLHALHTARTQVLPPQGQYHVDDEQQQDEAKR